MQNDNFCLCSNCFDNHIRTFWQHFQDEHNFCDVTLACEDKQIKAHRMVISSFSPVLKNIVKLNHQIEHTFIYLRRIKFGDLQNLVLFMYQGELNVAEEDVSSFLEVANDLLVRGLSEGNVLASDSDNTQNFQNVYQNPVLIINISKHKKQIWKCTKFSFFC